MLIDVTRLRDNEESNTRFINHNSSSDLFNRQSTSAARVHQCPAAPVCAPNSTLPANVPINTETKYPVFIVITASILSSVSSVQSNERNIDPRPTTNN